MSFAKKTTRCALTLFGLVACAAREYTSDLRDEWSRVRSSARSNGAHPASVQEEVGALKEEVQALRRLLRFQEETVEVRYGQAVCDAFQALKTFLRTHEVTHFQDLGVEDVLPEIEGYCDKESFYLLAESLVRLIPLSERKACLLYLKERGYLPMTHDLEGEKVRGCLTYKIHRDILFLGEQG